MAGGSADAVVILGKAQGRKRENRQLRARAVAAALLWHASSEPRPALAMVARDVADGLTDAERVKRCLAEFDVPPEAVVTRTWSNCTILEVRALRVLARAHGWGRLTVLTHPYHRARAQVLFDEVFGAGVARVLAVAPDLQVGEGVSPALLARARAEIAGSMPRGFDLLRETLVEWALSGLHRIDPRGRFERALATRIRPAS